MNPAQIMFMRKAAQGVQVNFPTTFNASGISSVEYQIDNNGRVRGYADAGLILDQQWLLSGAASDVTANWHTDSGNNGSGTHDTDLNCGADQFFTLSTGAAFKQHQGTVTYKRASDGVVLGYTSFFWEVEGDGGGTVVFL